MSWFRGQAPTAGTDAPYVFYLGNLQDGLHWEQNLLPDRPSCIYRPGYGIWRQGPVPISREELTQSPALLRALVQIKFFNGDVRYTEEELPYLAAWIEEYGVDRMLKFFQLLIRWKGETQHQLPYSAIGRLLGVSPT